MCLLQTNPSNLERKCPESFLFMDTLSGLCFSLLSYRSFPHVVFTLKKLGPCRETTQLLFILQAGKQPTFVRRMANIPTQRPPNLSCFLLITQCLRSLAFLPSHWTSLFMPLLVTHLMLAKLRLNFVWVVGNFKVCIQGLL